MRIGYIRVSTFEQNLCRQLENIAVDRVFTDHASGSNTTRPGLAELLSFVRDGDIVVVHSMDRFSRNLDELRGLVNSLTTKGIALEFITEQIRFTGDDAPLSLLLLSLMGAFAEFERSIIRERQREGIELAKKHGVYTGRKKSMTLDQVAQAREYIARGETKTQVARIFGISRETLYQYLRQ